MEEMKEQPTRPVQGAEEGPTNPLVESPPPSAATAGILTTSAPTAPSAYAMVVEDLVLASGSNKILRGVNMAIPSGQLYGILGESGAGKTTLLRLIARKLDESSLTITGTGFLPQEIWYIAQENVLYEHDTPRRCITFLYRLLYGNDGTGGSEAEPPRFGDASTPDEVAEHLLEKVKFPMEVIDRTVGTTDEGLSVGARRLLNVAMALCARAKVVMLDEPTTGLDSTTAANLVKTITDVCHQTGLTAICTIHQPSDEALQHFDSLTVMSEGQAFVPDPAVDMSTIDVGEGKGHASDYSHAELLLLQMKNRQLLPSALPPHWTPEQKKTALGDVDFMTQLTKLNSSETPPLGRQFALLLERFFVRNWANRFSIRFRIMISLGIAVQLGVCYFRMPYDDPTFIRDHIGFYAGIIGATFVPIVIAAGFFPAEKPSFVHEMSQSKRPSVLPYLFSRTMYDIILAFACSLFYFITFPMVDVPGRWATFWFTLLLQSFCSDSFGLILSIRFEPSVSIGAMIPAIGFPGMLLGTGLVSPPKEDAGWLFHILKWGTWFKYGFTGVVVEQFPLMSGSCTPYVDANCVYHDWQDAMDTNSIDRTPHAFVSSYAFNWMMMGLIFILFRVMILLQLNGLVSASKFRYKSATNWDEKVKKDQERLAAAGGDAEGDADTTAVVSIHSGEEPKVNSFADPDPQVVQRQHDEAVEQSLKRENSFIGNLEKAADMTLHWDLNVVASSRVGRNMITETVLAPQTGYALSGEVLAVLGPGSSGKTALLKVLSRMLPLHGYEAADSNISISCDFHGQSELPAKLPGARFVYQYDAFAPGDTVTGSVMRQLQLAMNHDEADEAELPAACASILKSMGIAHIAEKKASEISGGQMRRLSIACQIAHSPRILFLDEPTSGLDSELALECMEALRRFAINSNAIVICTLNQPGKRLLPTVDRFLFMRQGDAVFEGSLTECETAFDATPEQANGRVPTDLILASLRESQTARGVAVVEGSKTANAYYKSLMSPCPRTTNPDTDSIALLNHANAHEFSATGANAFFKRVAILFRRNVDSRIMNSPATYFAEMGLKLLVFPLIVGILFAQVEDPAANIRFGASFMVLAGICFCAMVSPVVTLAMERSVYERERRASDYSPLTYIVARWLFESVPEALFGLVGFGGFYFLVGFEGNFGLFYGTMMLCYYGCVGLSLGIAVVPMPVFVNCGIAAVSMITLLLSGGLIVTPRQIDRTWFMHPLEVFNPMRAAAVLQVREESSHTTFGTDALLAGLGLNRDVLDDETFLWVTLACSFVMFRCGGILIATFLHWLDTAPVRRMHPVIKSGASSKRTTTTTVTAVA